MNHNDPIYIGTEAISQFLQYCNQNRFARFVIVSDQNTYVALGKHVESALEENNYEVFTIVLKGEEVIADEYYLMQVLSKAPLGERVYVAVGSGTITDITRFISHRTRNEFISFPTASSVDGFTSIGAPLVLGGVKQTLICQPPLALFADLPTLQNAPHRLTAAGFGDMVGKFTSLADWRLGQLLWNEPYDETIAKRSRIGLDTCISNADEIGAHTEAGIRHLMDGLIESGLCMLDFGSSRPASGAEHHCSHYWEMMLLDQGRPAILHGAKVGFATTLIAAQYERILNMSREEVAERLSSSVRPEPEAEREVMRRAYGASADEVIQDQAPLTDVSEERFNHIKQTIIENWEDIQDIAASVPKADEIRRILSKVGAPTSAEELGLSADEVEKGLLYGHYLRNRFTVIKLSRMLGLSVLP